jgi:GT2 family glycosyltransferase
MSSAAPSFTVVVATRDRPGPLEACLRSLAALHRPPGGMEVVVVDDGGRRPALGAVEEASTELSVRLVRRDSPGGPAAARNDGAEAARGRWLAFVDDDCVAAQGWLAALAGALERDPGCAAGGRTVAAIPANRWMAASAELEALVYAHSKGFFAAKNLAVPAGPFAAMGGFDPAMRVSEDRDFCDRWRAAGRRLRYVPAAVVAHASPATGRAFLAQHLRYGQGSYAFHTGRRHRGGTGLRLDLGFYRRLLAHPWRAARQPRRARLFGLLVASQAATAAGYGLAAWSARAGRPPPWPD